MHKFYWNNTQRSGSGGATASSVASNAAAATSSQKISLTSAENCQADHQYNMDLSAVNIRHGHPEVPARAYGATASIKVGKKSLKFTSKVRMRKKSWKWSGYVFQLQFHKKNVKN